MSRTRHRRRGRKGTQGRVISGARGRRFWSWGTTTPRGPSNRAVRACWVDEVLEQIEIRRRAELKHERSASAADIEIALRF